MSAMSQTKLKYSVSHLSHLSQSPLSQAPESEFEEIFAGLR